MTSVVKAASTTRSGRFRKTCAHNDDAVKIFNFSNEEITPGRLVYQITKNDATLSRQFPRVLVSFATSINASNDASDKNVKESSIVAATVKPDQTIAREGEGVVAIISGSDTDENNHVHDGSETKQVDIMSSRLDTDSGTVRSTDDTNDTLIEKKDDVSISSTNPRPATRQQTAAAALTSGCDKMEMEESTTRMKTSSSCTSLSKKRKGCTVTTTIRNRDKRNKTKDEPTKIIKLHTGILYLYRGLNPRAEFVQKR